MYLFLKFLLNRPMAARLVLRLELVANRLLLRKLDFLPL
jgi:hypothetical protein